MFEHITQAPPDAILGLTEAFNADPSADKINLAVGVFKDASGQTPVLKCVKQAEQLLLETEKTKTYLGIEGLPDYRKHVGQLLFGNTLDHSRLAIVQTPGGTGGVRVAADFVSNSSLVRKFGSRIQHGKTMSTSSKPPVLKLKTIATSILRVPVSTSQRCCLTFATRPSGRCSVTARLLPQSHRSRSHGGPVARDCCGVSREEAASLG